MPASSPEASFSAVAGCDCRRPALRRPRRRTDSSPRTHSLDPAPVSVTMFDESLGLVSGLGGNVVALKGPSSGLLVNGGAAPDVSLSVHEARRVPVQHRLASRTHRLESGCRRDGWADPRARVHEAVPVHRSVRRVAKQDVQGAARKGTADEDVHQSRLDDVRRSDRSSTRRWVRRTPTAISMCSSATRTCSSSAT